jgi:hypothetical protein
MIYREAKTASRTGNPSKGYWRDGGNQAAKTAPRTVRRTVKDRSQIPVLQKTNETAEKDRHRETAAYFD